VLFYNACIDRFPEVFANFTVLNLVRAGYIPHINPQKMIPFPLLSSHHVLSWAISHLLIERRHLLARDVLSGHAILMDIAYLRLCGLRTYTAVQCVALSKEQSSVARIALNRGLGQVPLRLQQIKMIVHFFELQIRTQRHPFTHLQHYLNPLSASAAILSVKSFEMLVNASAVLARSLSLSQNTGRHV
jgi:hypothetical protein